MASFLPLTLTKLLALDFSRRMSIILERLICSSSLSLATLLALSLPTIYPRKGPHGMR
ncbi:conserved hypothetical protein [Ricinus communis]|uniref:Uncharacterized protein n=1 Tax=Ricinus communis TaxID=3988 RepID=B9TCT5_RICCO|nr:conserved hypothetical protein [Ricinus communis]